MRVILLGACSRMNENEKLEKRARARNSIFGKVNKQDILPFIVGFVDGLGRLVFVRDAELQRVRIGLNGQTKMGVIHVYVRTGKSYASNATRSLIEIMWSSELNSLQAKRQ